MSTELASYKPRIRYRTPLDNILETRGMSYELFKYYVGVVNACILTMDEVTGIEEYHDCKNIIFSDRPIRFVPGMEIHIETNNITPLRSLHAQSASPRSEGSIALPSGVGGSNVHRYKRFLYGTFHKWEMVSGKYLILSQKEVDSLTQKERRNLRMSL